MAMIESVNGDSTLARTARVKSHEHNCFHVPYNLRCAVCKREFYNVDKHF